MSIAEDKSKLLAQAYVARIERELGESIGDLGRVVSNAYETAYLRGSTDAIDDYLATYVPKMEALLARLDTRKPDIFDATCEVVREISDWESIAGNRCGYTGETNCQCKECTRTDTEQKVDYAAIFEAGLREAKKREN